MKIKKYRTGLKVLLVTVLLLFTNLISRANIIDSLELELLKTNTLSKKYQIISKQADIVRKISWQRAQVYHIRAYNLVKNSKDTSLICRALMSIGENYLEQSKLDSAVSFLNQSIFLSSKARLKKENGVALIDLGNLYRKTNNLEKAIEYYNKAYPILKESGNKALYSLALTTRGDVSINMKRYEEGIKDYTEALDIKGISNYAVCIILNNMAEAYYLWDKPDESVKYALKCYNTSQKIGDNKNMAGALDNMGVGYTKLKNYDSAEYCFNQCIMLALKFGINDYLQDAYVGLENLYEAEAKPELALMWYKKSMALKDSNITRENAAHIEDLEQHYKSHEKEQTIAILSRDKALQKAESEKKDLEAAEEISRLNNEKALQKLESAKAGLEKETKINALSQNARMQKIELGRQKAINYGIISFVFLLLVAGVIGFFNYHKIRQLNNNLDKQKGELTQLNDVKDKLLAIISHDLRSPLANMDAMLILLKKGNLTEEKLIEHSSALSGVLQQNIQLLDNLLQWAVSQMKGLEVRKKEVDITELIEENVLLVQSILDIKHITLTDMSEKELKVYVDISMIRLVLRNLLSNAVKYTPEGGKISLKTALKGNTVWVEVSDNGVGLDADIKKALQTGKLSESKPGTKLEKGFGLGLLLCKEFIEKNGGTLLIDSKPGLGSTFSFNLPLAAA